MRQREFKVLQQEAYQYIKDRILSGALEYNQIYSESRIALEVGISRTPVRDAVHRLYQEGYVDIIPNKGFALHKMNEQDVMETYEVRSAIEGYCARKAALHRQSPAVEQLLGELEASLARQQKLFEEENDPQAFSQEDRNFHGLLVSSSENEAFQDFFGQYMYKLQRLAALSLQKPHRMEETLAEHRRIFLAIRGGDPQEAYAAALDHIQAPLHINLENVYAGIF